MILPYKDAIKYLKVGTKVKAVRGKSNPCMMLDKDSVGSITSVGKTSFDIDGCLHDVKGDGWLEIVSMVEITYESLAKGDRLERNGDVYTVLARLEDLVFISTANKDDVAATVRHYKELERVGFTIEQPKLLRAEVREVTMAEVVAKFGENVVIKKEN